MYFVALAIGTVVSAVLLGVLKKKAARSCSGKELAGGIRPEQIRKPGLRFLFNF